MAGEKEVKMRIEKGSRLKFLPPKHQLLLKKIKPKRTKFSFSDDETIDFNVSGTINAGNGLISGSQFLVGSDVHTTLNIPNGVVRQDSVESIIQIPLNISGTVFPFKDNDISEVDNQDNSFYMTGSKVVDMGDGFLSPLHNKVKFEIDLTPTTNTSFGMQNYLSGSNNFVMSYWNNVLKRYEGVGSGREFNVYSSGSIVSLLGFLTSSAIAFGGSTGGSPLLGNPSGSQILANPINTFGFPGWSTYEASSSQLYSLNNKIKEPFLLEKVILYFSGSLNGHNYAWAGEACITSFFILNQRKTFINKLENTVYYISSGSTQISSMILSQSALTSSRDLVTWLQLSRQSSVLENIGLQRESQYSAPTIRNSLQGEFSQQFIVSGNVKSPFSYDPSISFLLDSAKKTQGILENYNVSGRNMINDLGRSWKNPWLSSQNYINGVFFDYYLTERTANIAKEYSQTIPYLLLPTDNLIFGWCLPTELYYWSHDNSRPIFTGAGPALTGSNQGVNKIVFYGSYLSANKERLTETEEAIKYAI